MTATWFAQYRVMIGFAEANLRQQKKNKKQNLFSVRMPMHTKNEFSWLNREKTNSFLKKLRVERS